MAIPGLSSRPSRCISVVEVTKPKPCCWCNPRKKVSSMNYDTAVGLVVVVLLCVLVGAVALSTYIEANGPICVGC